MKAQLEKKSGILNYFKPLKEKNLNNETKESPRKKHKQRIEALPKSTVVIHSLKSYIFLFRKSSKISTANRGNNLVFRKRT